MNFNIIKALIEISLFSIGMALAISFCFLILVLLCSPKMSGKERYISKHFAFLPKMMSNKKFIWLQKYYAYNTFGHGLALGGSVKTSYSKNKKYIYFTQRQGTFRPETKAEWSGNSSYFNLRKFLKDNNLFVNKYKKNKHELDNLKKTSTFFNQHKVFKNIIKLGDLK